MSIHKQVANVLTIAIAILLIISLSKDVQQLMSSRERIEKEQEEVSRLEKEQQELAKELEYVTSDEFVEKEAREKLLMSKPGETVVLLPPEEESNGETALIEGSGETEEELANWEKWLKLFL